MTIRTILSALLMLLSLVLSSAAQAQDPQVCWKPSYGRGVGTLPARCEGAQSNDAGLCYGACPPGQVGVGPACHTPCPAGWAPVGADPTAVSCWKPPLANDRQFSYGRGWGHVLVLSGPENCEREARSVGANGCEQDGLLLYPRCRAGYVGKGPACWQQLQGCPAGFRDDGLACAKPGLQGRGAGVIPTACEGNLQYQAGLCYQNCNAGFGGVGPVCWGQCPRGMPVDCGAMCGKTADDCAKAITQQVTGVLEVIVNVATTVATAGAGSGAAVGANAAKQAAAASGKAAVGNAARNMAKNVSKNQIRETVRKMAVDAGKSITENQLENLTNAAAGEDFDFTSLDPTGIASMIKNFVLPMCAADAPMPRSTGSFAVKGPGNPTVFLVDPTGRRYPIANPDVYFGCGFRDWTEVREVSPQVLAALPLGDALTSAQACQQRRDRSMSVMTAAPGPTPPTSGGGSGSSNVSPPAQGSAMAFPLLNPGGRPQGPITAASAVDPVFYMATYPDLMNAFRGNADEARNHWQQSGIREGRQSSPTFYIASYLARYEDLKAAFGNDYARAMQHWIDQGVREGRDASPNGLFVQGTLIRLPETGAVFLIDANGAKRWLTNPQVFEGCGLRWNMVQDLRRAVVDAVPTGANLNSAAECQAAARPPVPAGFGMRSITTGAVFVVDGVGARRAIANEQVLTGCGLQLAQMRNMFNSTVERVPAGAPIQTAEQCRALMASVRR